MDIISNCRNGTLVDPLDADAIAAALLELLKDRKVVVALVDDDVADVEAAIGDLDRLGADDGRLAELASNQCGVASATAARGQNAFRSEHAVHIIGLGLGSHHDDLLAFLGQPDQESIDLTLRNGMTTCFLAHRMELYSWGKVTRKGSFRQVIVNHRIGSHETLPHPGFAKATGAGRPVSLS